ncbi:O-antigen ligase, partial [Flavobacterium sp. 9AF]|uniref:O-antigen ligase family protein n=1 Tax=Flavobacterium sp. 9AF TaxID=2653142 RepID=UPI001F393A3A
MIFLLSRKAIIISLTLIFLIKVIQGKKINYMIALLVLIMIFSTAFFFPYIIERFAELSINNLNVNSSTRIRIDVWNFTYKAIKENLLIGVGWGNNQEYLNNIYLQNDCDYLFNKNSHNQFFQILLSSG